MKYFAIIDSQTKCMISCAKIPEGDAPEVSDGKMVVETTAEVYEIAKVWTKRWLKDQEDYVYNSETGEFLKSPWARTPATINKTTALADETDTITLTGLINPTQVRIPGIGTFMVEDGTLNLTFDLAGEYTIYCYAARHTKKVFRITVT